METFAKEMLAFINDDIRSSFRIHDPIFVVNQKVMEIDADVLVWLDGVGIRRKWVRYKHLHDNVFELKEYFFSPPDAVCLEIIDDAIRDVKKKVVFNSKLSFKILGVHYDEKEARKQMLYALRTGTPDIVTKVDYIADQKKLVCEVDFGEDELGRMISSGFAELKQKDGARA